jgi:hypothetical protein
MCRLLASLAAAVSATVAAAGPQPLAQRELSDRDSRFIEIPSGQANPGFRAVAPGKRIAFDESGVQMRLQAAALAGNARASATLNYAFDQGARVAPEGLKRSPTVIHWFVGEKSGWLTNLKSYSAISYRGVWPGVDAVFAGDAGGFKYQFEAAPGAKIEAIALVVTGADDVRVNASGALEWTIGLERLVDEAPLAFQPGAAGHDVVPAAYRVERLGANSWRVGFAVADHDRSRALIIDPAWTAFSGLVGGNAADQVYAVARDASGNTFACGITASSDLVSIPTGSTPKGGEDAFVAKFDSAGVPQFVAYIGGSGYDVCTGVALDATLRIYLAGGTTSLNFPAVGADASARFRRTKAADRDAFVMRLAPDGATIQYSGFIGGSQDDQANAIAVDSANRAYVTGYSTCTTVTTPGCATAGTAFPAFGGPSTSHGGDTLDGFGLDAFVARVDANGGTLEYAGFIGGNGGIEAGYGIAVGSDFSAYVVGETDSSAGLPSQAGTFRTSINARPADPGDGFVAKVAPNGASLSYFTLLTGGSAGTDRALAVAVESDNSLIVAGETDSALFPANTAGARVGTGQQATNAGNMDGFVLRLDATAANVTAATYIGGTGFDSATGVASDGTRLFVGGLATPGTLFPTVGTSGLATTRPGLQDGFLASIVRASPGAFAYSGFLGTAANEAIHALTASSDGVTTRLAIGGATTTAGSSGLTNPNTVALSGSAGATNGLVLRIDPFGPPASLLVQSGTPQSATINTAFAVALSLLVKDMDGLPVAGATVTFSAAPVGGATATFAPSATVTTNASGIASVTATANGSAGGPYTVTAQVNLLSALFSLTNTKIAQSITFAPLPNRTMADAPFTLAATASSGLAVLFSSTTTAVCTVTGATVTLAAPGVCTIAADQPGNASYGAAARVTQSFYLLGAGPAADSDSDGIPDPVELAEGRNPFLKDNDVFANARLFAMQQYRDFLGREGDPAGIQGWTDFVTAGTYSRPDVINAFLQSAEFSGSVAPVVRLYFAAFNRVPDYAGLTFNAGLVRSGAVTIAQLADFFVASPEFIATYGALDNTQFVTLLYLNVLGRAPDSAGLNGWVALLNAGTYSRGAVLLGFSESAENLGLSGNKVLVTMMYTGMLHRSPDPAGFNGWLGLLGTGTPAATVINGFFLSAEYHNRFLP